MTIPIQAALQDIKPQTPVAPLLEETEARESEKTFPVSLVGAVLGMAPAYVVRALGHRKPPTMPEVLWLLQLDAFNETFIPRSRIAHFLDNYPSTPESSASEEPGPLSLVAGDAGALIRGLPPASVQCVVTSSPYWGMRMYDAHINVAWADGEVAPYGHEQTPEGFVRHTVELLFWLRPALKESGSVWWNLMDTYNTRSPLRSNASEILTAMQGHETRKWTEHDARRHSAGHSFLKDGELCFVPSRVAERATRIGYFARSIITWRKTGSLPERVASRVSRGMEYILHLSVERHPLFNKRAWLELPPELGGKHPTLEGGAITDVWAFPTSTGRGGHGAQFPQALPGRCIALSSSEGDTVLDPFIGSGTTAVAALRLRRKCIGFDINPEYLQLARQRSHNVEQSLPLPSVKALAESELALLRSWIDDEMRRLQNLPSLELLHYIKYDPLQSNRITPDGSYTTLTTDVSPLEADSETPVLEVAISAHDSEGLLLAATTKQMALSLPLDRYTLSASR